MRKIEYVASVVAVAALSGGCTLVTDFEKDHPSTSSAGNGTSASAGGKANRGGTTATNTDSAGNGAGGATGNTAGATGVSVSSGGATGFGLGGGIAVGGTAGVALVGSGGVNVGGLATGGTSSGLAGMPSSGGVWNGSGGTSSAGGVDGVGGKTTGTGGSISGGGVGGTVVSGGTGGVAGNGASQGGASGAGNTAGSGGCTIEGSPYAAGDINSENNCQSCQPGVAPAQWSARPDGTGCGSSRICSGGLCVAVCTIASQAHSNGTVNPENPCETCDTSRALDAWSYTVTPRCVTDVSIGPQHACAVAGGKVYCWGTNTGGCLGQGTTTGFSMVSVVVPNLSKVTDIDVGDPETCASTGPDLYCWGRPDVDTQGNVTYHPSPVLVEGLPVGTKSSIGAGGQATCVVVNGDVYCWGTNSDYILGTDPVLLPASTTPIRLPEISRAITVSMGSAHACALTATGPLCWGVNESGQLGNGSLIGYSAPSPAGLFGTVSAIEAAGDVDGHSCVIADGLVRCVGNGSYGQLGDGQGSNMNTPVRVKGLAEVTHISAGGNSSCAIMGGDAYCWGRNGYGQLGNAGTENALTPTKVVGLPSGKATAISVSTYNGCAVASGNAYCWGLGESGRLGNNSVERSLTAVKVQIP